MRIPPVVVLSLLVLAVVPAVARADEEIVAIPGFQFATPMVEIDQGERLTFRSADEAAPHDVTSVGESADGRPLFKTPVIDFNQTAFVEGSQYLTTGSYAFVCSIHPGTMKGTLKVNTAGTPAQRPAPGSGGGEPPQSGGSGSGTEPGSGGPTPPAGEPSPGSDVTPPALEIALAAQRARTVRRRGSVPLSVRVGEAARVEVVVRIGSRRAGRAVATFSSAGSRKVTVRLTSAGRKALRRGRRLRLVVVAVDGAGNRTERAASTRLR